MHTTIKELLDLRDGAPVRAQAAQHLVACEQCGARLARLGELQSQLRQLPPFQPPARCWPAIEQVLNQADPAPSERPRRSAVRRAAALFGAIMLLSLLLWSSGYWRTPRASIDGHSADGLPQLVAQSQQLEALLRGLPRPAVERAATSAAIDELQTRIQVLDTQLSNAQESGLDGGQARQLWSARVQLLNSLLSVRYAEHAARSSPLAVIASGDI